MQVAREVGPLLVLQPQQLVLQEAVAAAHGGELAGHLVEGAPDAGHLRHPALVHPDLVVARADAAEGPCQLDQGPQRLADQQPDQAAAHEAGERQHRQEIGEVQPGIGEVGGRRRLQPDRPSRRRQCGGGQLRIHQGREPTRGDMGRAERRGHQPRAAVGAQQHRAQVSVAVIAVDQPLRVVGHRRAQGVAQGPLGPLHGHAKLGPQGGVRPHHGQTRAEDGVDAQHQGDGGQDSASERHGLLIPPSRIWEKFPSEPGTAPLTRFGGRLYRSGHGWIPGRLDQTGALRRGGRRLADRPARPGPDHGDAGGDARPGQ